MSVDQKLECPVCKKEYLWPYTKGAPPTCGDRMCVMNWKYRDKTRDLQTGEFRDIDDIGKL